MTSGYYRFPTIQNELVIFTSEDDLWSVPISGGAAHRLTANLGRVTHPALSPDGKQLAFVGREEGHAEVYLMPANGGRAQRLTYLGGSNCRVAGWTADGRILFANNAEHWYFLFTYLYSIDAHGGSPERLPYGLARHIAFGPFGAVVIGRNTEDPARWKRYRGGRMGQLWIDQTGKGEFKRLLPGTSENFLGNLTSPMWIGDPGRVFFISDHQGIGNLYSCSPTGEDLQRHTDHDQFYVRNAATDGRRIVYHAGGDLYLYDPQSGENRFVQVNYPSPQVQRNRKFVPAAQYLDDWALHPTGSAIALVARGKLFAFSNWEGPVLSYHLAPDHLASGEADRDEPAGKGKMVSAARYRLPVWLNDGKRLAAVSDVSGEETFVIFDALTDNDPVSLPQMDIGRPEAVAVNPRRDQLVFCNNRYEIIFLDLESHEIRKIDRGKAAPIAGFDWSPDGEWVAYSVSISSQVFVIKLWHVESGEITQLTEPVLRDVAPAFDPLGRFLYFISYRTFEPVFDALQFELSFPYGAKPYLMTLRKDLPSPFVPRSMMFADRDKNGEGPQDPPEESPPEEESSGAPLESAEGAENGENSADEQDPQADSDHNPPAAAEGKDQQPQLKIDLDGIQKRIIAFPVQDSLYGQVLGSRDGKVIYTRYPMEIASKSPDSRHDVKASGSILTYDFKTQEEELIVSGVASIEVSRDGKQLLYHNGGRLRVIKAGEKPKENSYAATRKTGWIDLDRVKLQVDPGGEWRQMFREAWRLQRDQFWTEDMSQVDWLAVYNRYLPLVERVGSRGEFSDLMWEMQGELGTSHAYEYGGDYRHSPVYSQGYLGADFSHHPESGGWQIMRIHRGDPWNPRADSPLNAPGLDVQEGDILLAVNGQRLSQAYSPAHALVNQAGEEVMLSLQAGARDEAEEVGDQPSMPRLLVVRALSSEISLRYRAWVEANRTRVHQASEGRIGYLHIPDMAAWGYAEFHRGFLAEVRRQGLVVDVRFNRGGNVSFLLLEKLAQRRIGYNLSRWREEPVPYPRYAIAGPMVALTNEYAGSDGDIFSHAFKLMKLGPLIGKRTWGGVVGIWPRHSLIDGTVTTQPEFSFWFADVGWDVENYGTDPDVEVDNLPQDYPRGVDMQLERAIEISLNLLAENPPKMPDFNPFPNKSGPRLD